MQNNMLAFSPQDQVIVKQTSTETVVWRSDWFVIGFALLVFLMCWFLLPDGGTDWRNDIQPAIRHGGFAPWEEGLPLPPWSVIALSPLGWLSARAATAAIGAISVVTIALLVRRFSAPDWITVPIMLSPSGFWLLINGQTEWLMLLGVLFSNGLDVMLLTLKPQVGLWVIPAHLRRAGHDWWKYLLPSCLLIAVSFVIWPLWPVHIADYRHVLLPADWNASLWPYSIPFGVVCSWRAWRTGDERWGLLASPFLFPYVNLPSYIGVLIVIFSRWPRICTSVYGFTFVVSVIILFVQ